MTSPTGIFRGAARLLRQVSRISPRFNLLSTWHLAYVSRTTDRSWLGLYFDDLALWG